MSSPTEPKRSLHEAIQILVRLKQMTADHDPVWVIAGDQSSGKSSLVHALTGVPLPADKGMTTRGPTRISLRPSAVVDPDRQEARCWLKMTHCTLDEKLDHPFIVPKEGGWMTLHRLSTLLPGLARAAVTPLKKTATELPSHAFTAPNGLSLGLDVVTRNEINIEIKGASQSAVVFVDLPGFAAGAADSTRDAVDEVAKGYLDMPGACLVACLSGESEPSTQAVNNLIEHVEAQGKKAMRVVTKTDRIEVGGWWADKIARGETTQDFFVRAATLQDLKHPATTARQRIDNERAWFNSHQANQILGGFVSAERCGVTAVLAKSAAMLEERRREKLVECADRIQGELDNLRPLCAASKPPDRPDFVDVSTLLRDNFDLLEERLYHAFQLDGEYAKNFSKQFAKACDKLVKLTPIYGPLENADEENVFTQKLVRNWGSYDLMECQRLSSELSGTSTTGEDHVKRVFAPVAKLDAHLGSSWTLKTLSSQLDAIDRHAKEALKKDQKRFSTAIAEIVPAVWEQLINKVWKHVVDEVADEMKATYRLKTFLRNVCSETCRDGQSEFAKELSRTTARVSKGFVNDMSSLKDKLMEGYDDAYKAQVDGLDCPPTPSTDASSASGQKKPDKYRDIARVVSVNLAVARCEIMREIGNRLLNVVEQFAEEAHTRLSTLIVVKSLEPHGHDQIISLVHEEDPAVRERYEELLNQCRSKENAFKIIEETGVLNVWAGNA